MTENITHVVAEAQRLRAEAIADGVVAIGRGIAAVFAPLARLGKRTAASFERQRQADRLYGELSRMTDRDLADIGLTRGDIMAVAEGTYRRETAPAAPVVELRPAAKVATEKPQLPHAA